MGVDEVAMGSVTVRRVGLGAMPLAARTRDEGVALVRRAVELGVNHIDTAAFYFSPGVSVNQVINAALGRADDVVIATKVGPARGADGQWLPAGGPADLRWQVEENLRQLGRDHVDVANLRIGVGAERGTGSIADRVGALAELRQAGLVREIGISNVGPEHLDEALAVAPVVCVQNQYGVDVRREDDALVRACGERGVAFVPFFSIVPGGHVDGGREVPLRVAGAVDSVAARLGVSPAQVRIAWTLRQGAHVVAIPGTGDPRHLEENVAAEEVTLSAEDLAELG